jgi:cysteine desulfurase
MAYLDYAATTPVLPEVTETMISVLESDFGNPSSVHAYGRRAREVVEDARDRVASAINASPAEVVFTGSGTEANNLAIKGAAGKLRGNGNHIVVSAFEHHAVLDTAHALAKQGFEVTEVPVGSDGIVDPAEVAAAVRPATILVSIMAVNNEIGTVQNITEIAEAVRGANKNTLFHSDAVQVLGNIPVDVPASTADLVTFSAHKLGGPKGVGVLYVRAHVPIETQLHGGGQERGLRSGTLNVASIAGFGVAAEIAAKEVHEKAERVGALRDSLLEGIEDAVPDAQVNGSLERRVCGNLNVSIPGTEGETLLLLLDQAGIACSSGSACSSGALDPSHVLLAIGVDRELAKGSLRFSLGRESTSEDVQEVVDALPEVVAIARRAA